MYGHSFEHETYIENCVQLYEFSCEPKSFVGSIQVIKHLNLFQYGLYGFSCELDFYVESLQPIKCVKLVPFWCVWVFM